MQRSSQNYPNITLAQCRSSWQVPLARAQHPTGTVWLFLTQDPCPVLCWLVPPCSQCSSVYPLHLLGRSPWEMHPEGCLHLSLYSCAADKFAGSLHVP